MKIKRAFCTDCYEWRNVADLELWEENQVIVYYADSWGGRE